MKTGSFYPGKARQMFSFHFDRILASKLKYQELLIFCIIK